MSLLSLYIKISLNFQAMFSNMYSEIFLHKAKYEFHQQKNQVQWISVPDYGSLISYTLHTDSRSFHKEYNSTNYVKKLCTETLEEK